MKHGSSQEGWWRKRAVRAQERLDARGPEYAALSAYGECASAPVSVFLKQLREGQSEINLSHYHLGPQGAVVLARSVHASSHVQTLLLADCGLRDEGVAAVVSALIYNTSVLSLDLSRNVFGCPGCAELHEALLVNSSLTRLVVAHCGLRDADVATLAHALFHNTTLRLLDVSANGFGVLGARKLGAMLKRNHYLHHLLADWNEVRLEGAAALAEGLIANGSLETLSLAHNALHDFGAIKLGDALVTNCSLRRLCLRCNSIGMEGVYAIAHGLTRNAGLTSLDVSGNTVGEEGGKRLWDSVKGHPSLCSMGLDNIGANMKHNHRVPLLHKTFDPDRTPTGFWELDLSVCWHRWLLLKMVERCNRDDCRALESIKNFRYNGKPLPKSMKLPGPAGTPPSKGLNVETAKGLPPKEKVSFDYFEKIGNPLSESKETFDLRSSKQREIAVQCYQRACKMPYELLKDMSISGKQIDFSKEGGFKVRAKDILDSTPKLSVLIVQIPSKGVLSFVYVITKLEADTENLDGSHELNLAWPWDKVVAETIVSKVVAKEGVCTNCLWDNMHYSITPTNSKLPPMGTLSLDFTSLHYQPQHEACYCFNMSCDIERWIAARLRERNDVFMSPLTAQERAGQFIQNVLYAKPRAGGTEPVWSNWFAEWKKLPSETPAKRRGADPARPIDAATIYAQESGDLPSSTHREMEYFLPREGTLMVRYVAKAQNVVLGESYELDMDDTADR